MKRIGKVLTVIGGITVVSGLGYLLATKKSRDMESLFKTLDVLGDSIDENISILDELFECGADEDLILVKIREVDDLVSEYNSKIIAAENKYKEDFEMTYGYHTVDWSKDEYVRKVQDIGLDIIDLDVEHLPEEN